MVPLDERDGLICGPLTKETKETHRITQVLRSIQRAKASVGVGGLSCSCPLLELLMYHELGTIAEKDITFVLMALRQSYREISCQNKFTIPNMSLEGEASIRHIFTYSSMVLTTGQRMPCLHQILYAPNVF